ncbi:MAG: PQQ-dependent sugar dehydrogenase [Gammaproteobacteria bacterium]|nr:PQQ-dependent sugar dehydrogenase [Gammaproteobacteria bacterium]
MHLLAHRLGLLFFCCIVVAAAQASVEKLAYQEQVITVDGERRVAWVPQGYRLELLTGALEGPRLLTFSGNGDLFIGSKSGKVYRLPPPYTVPQVLVTLGGYPHSVAFRANEILIARTDGVYRAPYRLDQEKLAPDVVKLLTALPGGGGHNSRSVGVGPDGRVYVSLGISSNCSDQYLDEAYPFNDRRGGIMVLREGGGKARWETYASGLRNAVGFAWHPASGVLYASNNGPDHLGYEQPPEYFSRIDAGSFHGMPWFQYDGQRMQRDGCIVRDPPRPMQDVVAPVVTFPSRNAPMGVTFVPKGALDKTLEFDAIVALHGSWGTQPDGGFFGDAATRRPPKIVAVRFKEGRAQRVDDLVTGFQLQDGERWARPVGVAMGPDGALYFTSDGGVHGLFRLKKYP